jgi:hypothetical protein
LGSVAARKQRVKIMGQLWGQTALVELSLARGHIKTQPPQLSGLQRVLRKLLEPFERLGLQKVGPELGHRGENVQHGALDCGDRGRRERRVVARFRRRKQLDEPL